MRLKCAHSNNTLHNANMYVGLHKYLPPPPLTCPHFVLLQLGTEMDLFGIMRHESTQNSPFYYYYLCKALYLELHQCLDFLSILSHYSTDIDGIQYVYVYGMYMCVCVFLTQITPSSHLSGYCMA